MNSNTSIDVADDKINKFLFENAVFFGYLRGWIDFTLSLWINTGPNLILLWRWPLLRIMFVSIIFVILKLLHFCINALQINEILEWPNKKLNRFVDFCRFGFSFFFSSSWRCQCRWSVGVVDFLVHRKFVVNAIAPAIDRIKGA